MLSIPSSPTMQCITTGTLRLKTQLFAQGSLPQFVSLSPVHNFSQHKMCHAENNKSKKKKRCYERNSRNSACLFREMN